MTDYSGRAVGAAIRKARQNEDEQDEEAKMDNEWAIISEGFRRPVNMPRIPEPKQKSRAKVVVAPANKKKMSKAERKQSKKQGGAMAGADEVPPKLTAAAPAKQKQSFHRTSRQASCQEAAEGRGLTWEQ
ncbi:unnamed protein product [Polarella glacialis]|uniref:Uncharacterized protein n=1 Tax=Polarella glacialis TaxID=89957 RepID=A0A813E0E1_POLGL|nr:unnamed protein product [Polarella glacialis]CAE8657186.1 unnamed protein product [Polarella glacialis]|mmetsp:Transcript_46366/g.75361  ORF Transcript_46366/g.75361 Transcript_46366/m.75361 type:complete len:130 (-) Transcript_46366:46-435(-)